MYALPALIYWKQWGSIGCTSLCAVTCRVLWCRLAMGERLWVRHCRVLWGLFCGHSTGTSGTTQGYRVGSICATSEAVCEEPGARFPGEEHFRGECCSAGRGGCGRLIGWAWHHRREPPLAPRGPGPAARPRPGPAPPLSAPRQLTNKNMITENAPWQTLLWLQR